MHGVGPVWSPDGKHVVIQRSCETVTYSTGEVGKCSEEHDVVIVTVTDDDPAIPVGTQTVIPRAETGAANARKPWFPYSVTWSADSTTLLYLAWSSDPYEEAYSTACSPCRSAVRRRRLSWSIPRTSSPCTEGSR